MVKNDNPAGRLHAILLAAKSQNLDTPMRRVWATAFDLEETDLIGIYSNLVRLNDSLSTVEKDIGLQDLDSDIYLQHVPEVRRLLSLSNLDGPLRKHIDLLDEGVLMTLQFCSERLSKACPERVPTADELSELNKDIADLSEKLEKAEINRVLKTTLADLLESMRRAVAEYKIRGATGLRQELFFVLERLQRTIPYLEEHKDSPEVRSFWDIVVKYDTLTSIYVNAPQVIAGAATGLRMLGFPVS
jgi:hypothetical protein